eukprot:1193878-Prorocentrum_minimum.AAC.1
MNPGDGRVGAVVVERPEVQRRRGALRLVQAAAQVHHRLAHVARQVPVVDALHAAAHAGSVPPKGDVPLLPPRHQMALPLFSEERVVVVLPEVPARHQDVERQRLLAVGEDGEGDRQLQLRLRLRSWLRLRGASFHGAVLRWHQFVKNRAWEVTRVEDKFQIRHGPHLLDSCL